MDQENLIFINQEIASLFTDTLEGLEFPIDEWACYLQTPFLKPWQFTKGHMEEWLLEGDIYLTLQRIWGNITRLSSLYNESHIPVLLDIASGPKPPSGMR